MGLSESFGSFRVEPGSSDDRSGGAAQASKLKAWSRHGKSVAEPELRQENPAAAAFRRSNLLSCVQQVCVVLLLAGSRHPAIRAGQRRIPRAHPPERWLHLRSYIGKSKSILKLKRWIAVTKCTPR